MYENSKSIVKKISDSGCLTKSEITAVEIGLRIHDAIDEIMNEYIGVSKENKYELEHKVEF